jgi:hypothetical protein
MNARRADPAVPASGSRPAATILAAGLAAGALDITAAFATWAGRGVTPVRILQGITSGLLGADSFRGGWRTAALGLGFQFLIAITAAAVFYAGSRRLAVMTRRPILSGAVYGIAVYLVMYWIVMPLSRVHRRPFSGSATLLAVATHVVCVGIPISVVVARAGVRRAARGARSSV